MNMKDRGYILYPSSGVAGRGERQRLPSLNEGEPVHQFNQSIDKTIYVIAGDSRYSFELSRSCFAVPIELVQFNLHTYNIYVVCIYICIYRRQGGRWTVCCCKICSMLKSGGGGGGGGGGKI